jgi:hypothetical protein
MKNLKYIVVGVLLLTAGTVFGATAKKVIEVVQKDYVAQVYITRGDVKIYKVNDGVNTCYISDYNISGGGINVAQQGISCVKN